MHRTKKYVRRVREPNSTTVMLLTSPIVPNQIHDLREVLFCDGGGLHSCAVNRRAGRRRGGTAIDEQFLALHVGRIIRCQE